MTEIKNNINNYLDYCKSQKRLDEKTLKAYRIDLNQFSNKIIISSINEINISTLENYISFLNNIYKPKTVKRKLASIKALPSFSMAAKTTSGSSLSSSLAI